MIIYAKCYQRDELYNYYKIDPGQNPILVEVVSFLNALPYVRVDTYSRETSSGRIEIDALLNHYPRIENGEYEGAFRKATKTDFEILG